MGRSVGCHWFRHLHVLHNQNMKVYKEKWMYDMSVQLSKEKI